MSANFTWEQYRVLEEVFPLVTNCELKYIGSAGTSVTDSGLCVLSINILNQKTFILSWYLLILVIIFTGLKALMDILLMALPGFRYLMFRSRAKSLPTHVLSRVHRNVGFGNYTLLMLIAKNIESTQFESLLTVISEKIAGADLYPSSLMHMSVKSPAKKVNSDYPVIGKQPSYNEAATIDVRLRNEVSPPGYRSLQD